VEFQVKCVAWPEGAEYWYCNVNRPYRYGGSYAKHYRQDPSDGRAWRPISEPCPFWLPDEMTSTTVRMFFGGPKPWGRYPAGYYTLWCWDSNPVPVYDGAIIEMANCTASVAICIPELKILVSGPSSVCANTEYSLNILVENIKECAGKVRLLLDDKLLGEGEIEARGTMGFTPTLMMPYEDISHIVKAEILGEGNVWQETNREIIPIAVTFPNPSIEYVDAPKSARPGTEFNVKIKVKNLGCPGDVMLIIRNLLTGEETSHETKLASGALMDYVYTSEMPPEREIVFRAVPQYLGRGKKWYNGQNITEIKIKAIDTLLHEENRIWLLGGLESNTFTGFVAGKNVKVEGLDIILGTGGPFGNFVSYDGYILSGNLRPGDIATIEFDELYYLRVETDKDIATAMQLHYMSIQPFLPQLWFFGYQGPLVLW